METKRKFGINRIILFCIVILICILTGCNSVSSVDENTDIEAQTEAACEEKTESLTEEETTDESEYFSTPEEITALGLSENLLAFYLVLNSKKPFVSADEGCQEFYWNEYFWRQGELQLSFTTLDFMLVDMDDDGEDELVLTGHMPETTQVLDYQEGMVYSYQFVYRGMKGILTSGVYNGSSGADIGGFYRITYFDKGAYEEERLAYMNHDYYEVEGVEVSSEEFYAYIETFADAEQAEDIDFTEENLEEKLLGDLTAEEFSVIENIAMEAIIEEDIPYTAEELQAYSDVLTEGKEFICVTDEGQKLFLEDNYVRNETGDDEYQVLYFSIVDMDGDEEPEIVLSCYPDTVLILHDTKESVRGYRFSIYDEIREIAKDGVYSFDRYGVMGYEKIVSFDEDGCLIEAVDNHEDINDDRIRYYFFSEEKIESTYSDEIIDKNDGKLNFENPYFYPQEDCFLSADIKYIDVETVTTINGELRLQWLKEYDNGNLFKLTVESDGKITDRLGEERLNIYFYVTADNIYRLWSYVVQNGEVIEFYNNDILLMETLDTDEKLIANSEMVCCMYEKTDELEPSEVGSHVTIIQREEQIAYNRVDIGASGNREFYESFVWEEGKGLVEYKSGYKVESEILYIENIFEEVSRQDRE